MTAERRDWKPVPARDGMTRREFLRLAGGVVVAFSLLPEVLTGAESRAASAVGEGWLRVAADGRVTVFAPVPETGQGIRTVLAQLAAEELSVDLSSVQVVLADTNRVPPPPSEEGLLGVAAARVRSAAAQAREIIADLAAERWGVDRSAIVVADGRALVSGEAELAIGIGELVAGRRLTWRPDRPVPLKHSSDHVVVGESVPRLGGLARVTGEARFVRDVHVPNLAYGRLLRPPCVRARLARADTSGAAEQADVIAVVRDGTLIGVVARTPEAAERGVRSIAATWEETDHPSASSLFEDLRASARLDREIMRRGDVETTLASARHGYSASYRAAYTAGAPIEPPAALAVPEDDRILLYVSTGKPFAHRDAVAAALGLAPARVRVVAPVVGGDFGAKDGTDISVQAARLARSVGRPVLMSLTGEDALTRIEYRPAGLVDVRCGVSGGGEIAAWQSDVFNCGAGGAVAPYDIPNQRVRSYRCRAPLPQTSGLETGPAINAFAREVQLDHVASDLGEDPVAIRLRHLQGNPRLSRVVRTAAEKYGWTDRRTPTGLGLGFACAAASGAYAAEVVEVEVDGGSGPVRVRRVVVAQDTGLIVNPDNLESQVQGAVVRGIGMALREMVRYEQGRILSRSFASYPVPAFGDTPEIAVVLVDEPSQPPQETGAPAVWPLAAAIANAIFDAAGVRIRELPLARQLRPRGTA